MGCEQSLAHVLQCIAPLECITLSQCIALLQCFALLQHTALFQCFTLFQCIMCPVRMLLEATRAEKEAKLPNEATKMVTCLEKSRAI